MDLRTTEGDIELVGGDLDWVDGPEAVRQDIEMALRTWLGESADDRSVGVPYLQVIFRRGTTEAAIEYIIKELIRSRQGVADVLGLATELGRATRELVISGSVRLTDEQIVTFGPVEVSP